MITATSMMYIYTETPLHAGVGSGLSSVELPIQRERHTQYPMIQGSSIKGKLRALISHQYGSNSDGLVKALFGHEHATQETDQLHAGALIVSDARILLFPVRSLQGVFAYTTSLDILERFRKDLIHVHQEKEFPQLPSTRLKNGEALVTEQSEVTISQNSHGHGLLLEEFSFEVRQDQKVTSVARWLAEHALPFDGYWAEKLQSSLVVLADDDFRDFVLYSTEVITRIAIDQEKKTVKEGALWTEEHLPADTLLYAPIYATNERRPTEKSQEPRQGLALLRDLSQKAGPYLQLGGDETVGRGFVKVRWSPPASLTDSATGRP
ncbi:type III-B CRISPR module RAMP protein Cmr4 [Thermogemmatispora tikiterensis]|uniref:Type III-B CRISPR module RAMP protein Cmr4 n=1 Tax=Thermogemmatispora tikiterensis TaxID=1825093 RepID=A0A328VK77_9CHLR|nr:type III-B CRISPR module RAMP protein Cmr4 [Thermogemmatispora tikiterensis]RAQ98096.1 type III-B CRISPR module RAMP protein Cmr4 [Thermogemmatispora tikiterensis]